MKARGTVIGLGTHGGCTKNRLSVFEGCAWPRCSRRCAIWTVPGSQPSRSSAWAPSTARGSSGCRLGRSRRAWTPIWSRSDPLHPSLHPPTNLLKNVVYAMSPQAVTDAWVRGRHVVKDQRLTLLDQDALMERVQALDCD